MILSFRRVGKIRTKCKSSEAWREIKSLKRQTRVLFKEKPIEVSSHIKRNKLHASNVYYSRCVDQKLISFAVASSFRNKNSPT